MEQLGWEDEKSIYEFRERMSRWVIMVMLVIMVIVMTIANANSICVGRKSLVF